MTRAAATIMEHRAAEGTTVLHLTTPPKGPTAPPSSSLALIDEACLMRDFPDCALASVRVVASPSRAQTYLLSIAPLEKRVRLPPAKRIHASASSSSTTHPTALARVDGLCVRIQLFSAPPFDTATTVGGLPARLLSPAELLVDLVPFAPVPPLTPLRLGSGGGVVEVPVVMS